MLDARLGIHKHRRYPVELHLDPLALVCGARDILLDLIDLLAREILAPHILQVVELVLEVLLLARHELDLLEVLALDVVEGLRRLILRSVFLNDLIDILYTSRFLPNHPKPTIRDILRRFC